jgi:hypothetical protein
MRCGSVAIRTRGPKARWPANDPGFSSYDAMGHTPSRTPVPGNSSPPDARLLSEEHEVVAVDQFRLVHVAEDALDLA